MAIKREKALCLLHRRENGKMLDKLQQQAFFSDEACILMAARCIKVAVEESVAFWLCCEKNYVRSRQTKFFVAHLFLSKITWKILKNQKFIFQKVLTGRSLLRNIAPFDSRNLSFSKSFVPSCDLLSAS